MEQNEKIGAYSVGINLILAGIKALLGFLSRSVAFIADAIHYCTNVISFEQQSLKPQHLTYVLDELFLWNTICRNTNKFFYFDGRSYSHIS